MKPFVFLPALLTATISATALAGLSGSDSFESGDLSASSAQGFTWNNTNNTSLVKYDPAMGDMVIFQNMTPVELQEGTDGKWQAKDGNVALRYFYPPGRDSWSEQRFTLNGPEQEVWFRYWLKVPDNFKHPTQGPSNMKLFSMWMDDYSNKGDGPTVIWEFWDDKNGGSQVSYHYSPGGYLTAGEHQGHTQFITYPRDQGRWMQIVIHVKAASARGANDGVMQLYRRWEDESSFSLLHDDQNADIAAPPAGPNGWKYGYFMGWSNAGYEANTEWLMDGLVMSNSSLLSGDLAATPAAPAAPEPSSTGMCAAPTKPTISRPS